MNAREEALRGLKVQVEQKTRASHDEAVKRSKEKTPVRYLSSIWKEELQRRYGYQVVVTKWGKREASLVAKMIKESDVDLVEQVIREFLRNVAKENDIPGVGLLWVMRGKVLARVRGQVKTGTSRIREGEWDAELAAQDEGWGDGE